MGITEDQGQTISRFYCENCTRRDPALQICYNTRDFSSLRVFELKRELTARGLPPRGNKPELLRLLLEHDRASPDPTRQLIVHDRTRVLKRIPKGSRPACASLLAQLVEKVIDDPSSTVAWRRLFAFAPVCLSNRGSTKTKRKQASLASAVNRQVQDFDKSWHIPIPNDKSSDVPRKKTKEDSIGKIVSAKICDGDIRGAIRVASSEESIAPFSPETLDELKAKHPGPSPGSVLPPGPSMGTLAAGPLVVDGGAVRKAVTSFPAGSSGGIDGLRPQHLKDMVARSVGEPGNRLLNALTGLCNLCFKGNVPANICPIFFGASLCALSKPGVEFVQ